MPDRRRTRERQLAKLAARRAAERRRRRRRRLLTITGAMAVAIGGLVFAVVALAGGGKNPKPLAAPSATPTPGPTVSASPGAACGYKTSSSPTRKSGPLPPPPFTIDVNKRYTATITTNMGTIGVELLPKDAPCAVNSFVYLADKHFYDRILFHRIVKGFVDQAGDPLGTGPAEEDRRDPVASGQGVVTTKPRWDRPPPMEIDPSRRYTAVIETSKGTITAELFAGKAPRTANNFVFLARQGFFDGLAFHRVIPGFVIQGGDPR